MDMNMPAEKCSCALIAGRRSENSIPPDWRILAVKGVAATRSNAIVGGPFGSDLVSSDYVATGVPVVRGQNMAGHYVSGDFVFVSPGKAKELQANTARAGDLIFTQRGTLGQVSLVPAGPHDEYVVSQSQMKLTLNVRIASAEYIYQYFVSAWGQKQIIDSAIQTGVPHTNLGILKKYEVPFPPTLKEQQAIAEALSDADALIESLSLLLTKKRQIKQGTMQELLTGKKRLPGFSGEWLEMSLGELFQFSGGLSASRDQLSTSGHLYLHYGDIHTSARTFVDAESQGDSIPRLDMPIVKIQPTALLADGDVVFVDASEDDDGVSKHVVVVNPHGVPFISGLHTIVAKQKREELDGAYLRYCFQTQAVKAQFKFYAVGTKVSGISKKNIAKIMLAVPPHDEQSAIAELLVSIEKDIDELELKLSKARQLKLGMMQELLTGRIRLVQPGSNVIALPLKPAASNPPPSQPAHNWQINEAVVIGALAQRFGNEKFPLPRKRRVKLMYLLHRHIEGRAEGYLKKAAGPYDPNTKYKGPEAIALKNGYVRAVHNGTYEGFVAGGKSDQAQRYFEQWYGTAAMNWLERFHYRKTDELELLATVDMAMVDLAAASQSVDVAGVKRVIATHPEWLPKLSRELFSDEGIRRAIAECAALFPA